MRRAFQFIKIYIVAFISLFANNIIYAQDLYPEITNYSFGSSQNWSIDVCDSQTISVANNSGLAQFNGQSWSMNNLPKNMIIRSVYCHDDRIYVGSYEEFGYWKKNEFNLLEYYSLKSKFEENSPKQSEEFWEILYHNQSIYFRSFGAIYKYDGQNIETITDSINVSSLSVYGDKLLFASFSEGIFEFVDNEVRPFNAIKTLADLNNVNLLSTYQDYIFANDTNLGAFLLKNNELINLSNSLNEILKSYTLNKIEFIDDKTIAFGTVTNGLIIYNISNQSFKIINKQSGIRNNTILDIKYNNGFLWLALDNGVSKIDIKSELSYFNDFSGILGTVYDVTYFKNKYYLASNTGVYTFIDNELSIIKNSEGHCWEILEHKNDLFFGHNNGAFVLRDDVLVPINGSFSGVYNYLKIPNSDHLLISTYSGIGVLENHKSDFKISKLSGIDVPVDNLVFENDTTLWATDNYDGLFKINFDNTRIKVKDIIQLKNHPLILDSKVELQNIKGTLYFIVNDKWYTYSRETNKFTPFFDFENEKVLGVENEDIWILDKESFAIKSYNQGFEIKKKIINKNLISKFVHGYEKIAFKDDSTKIFNLKDGFGILNSNKITSLEVRKPVVSRVYAGERIYNIENDYTIQLSHKASRQIIFDVYTPGNYNNQLRYRLNGEINESEAVVDGRFKLQNLPSGDYTIELLEQGNTSNSRIVNIDIAPPWYFSTLAKVLYLFSFILVIYLVGIYQKNKSEKLHAKAQKELLRRSKERMASIEKENLLNEVKTKKKELTNRTATIVQKNEAIILLRNELKRLQKTSPNVVRTKNILHRSGEQLDSKNDWKLFEAKFNELNEDFFEALSREYPKLTTKDRKLCAYIKVGLTSKEIAPLLGITARSVELQRYRLRKKLNLDTKITFNEFLDKF